MTVYLDVVFFENVLMNYIILFACVVVLRINCKKLRILFSSLIGAAYTVIMYLNILPLYSSFFMKVMLSFVMVFVAFKPMSLKQMVKEVVIFYFVSFVFGGCVFALMYFLKPQLVEIRNGVFVGTYPIKVAIIGGSVAFIVLQVSFKLVKSKISKKDMVYKIQVCICGKNVDLKALLDTGNLLKEPITGLPVVIVEKECLKEILPEKIFINIDKIVGGDADDILNNECFGELISRFRMIPFSSVGKQNGLLLGIKSDCVNVLTEETIETIPNVIIGVYDKSFTKNGAYSAIIGLDMLEGGNVNENVSNVKV